MAEMFDAIVIGAGQAGGPLSTALAQHGWKTAIIERNLVGGTCVNIGCTPSKTMIASARVAHLARRAGDYGVQVGAISIDLTKVRQRKRDIVESFREGSISSITGTDNLELIYGEARFIDSKTLSINLNEGGTRQLQADKIFINTGGRATIPSISGIESTPYYTEATLMELDTVPEHLIIVGGGYIGLEFGQMYARFGSQVTVIEHGDRLIPHEDVEISEAVTDILREDGIEIILNGNAKAVKQNGSGITLTIATDDGEKNLNGSHLLLAAGRTPNTDALDPAAAGVELGKHGHIKVNDRLETNVAGIYALGDVTGGPAFTHISYDDFRIVRTNVIENGQASTDDRIVSYTLFIDPQLGRAGLSETQALEQGYEVKIAKIPASRIARARETDETRGLWKAVIDAKTDQILGCAILGVEGGEVMGAVQMAMMGKLKYTTIRDSPFSHPTLVESLNNLFTAVED